MLIISTDLILCIISVVEANKRCKQIREMVIVESQNKPLTVLQLLMNAAKLELKLREVRKSSVLDGKG